MSGLLPCRWWIKWPAGIALTLWLFFGIYEPVFHGLPCDPGLSASIYYAVVTALAPWYYLVEEPRGPMLIFAIHTTATRHILSWGIFSFVSFAIWVVLLGSIQALRSRVHNRRHR